MDIDLLHVHFLVELWRELGRLQQPSIDAGRHGGRVGADDALEMAGYVVDGLCGRG